LAERFPQLTRLKISAERFLKVLSGLGIDYVMIGGIPVGFYGEPRFTQDLDFAVDPRLFAGRFAEFLQEIERENFMLSSSRPTAEELKSTTSLRFIDLRNKTIIDLVLHSKGFNWDHDILNRRREEKLLPGRGKIWCVSLEDLIVMKIANGEPQDYKDLEGIISRRFKKIDWSYLRKRAKKFNLIEEVEEIYKRFSIS